QVFKTFKDTPPFDSLIRTVDKTQLRILAPQKDSTFDPAYFDPYIVQAWQQYQSQSLTLQPLPYNGATYISTGSVDANNVFNFVTTPGNTKHTIGKPTSTDVFGCAGVFNPTGSGLERIIDGDIKNQVSSALNRTILLNSDSSTWCDASKYYLNSITNYYAKILHELSINGKSYAFPYDDKCEQSSTIVDTSPTEIVLTLTAFNGQGTTPSERIALKADNEQYVSADLNQGGRLVANRNQISDWESFDLIKLDGNKIGLRADNGQYVSADFNEGGKLVANRDEIEGWETFELIKLDGNKFGLRAANQKYVSADLNQGGILVANRNQISDWESFELIER
ncbi:MAG: beta-1,3-glucanase family protein, partial [Prochloraceae cyanobacterium]|nr:beta-1,3-glucanase family protein [Prochloraceae cyanobacterium]